MDGTGLVIYEIAGSLWFRPCWFDGLGHKVGEFEKVLWFKPWLLLVLRRFYVYWFWFIRSNRFLILDLRLFSLVCICLTTFSV